MKKRKEKEIEYINKYSGIPLGYEDRLSWMIDTFNVSEKKMNEILNRRDEILREMTYSSLRFVLYEEPEGSPRPRFRIINRNQLLNADNPTMDPCEPIGRTSTKEIAAVHAANAVSSNPPIAKYVACLFFIF